VSPQKRSKGRLKEGEGGECTSCPGVKGAKVRSGSARAILKLSARALRERKGPICFDQGESSKRLPGLHRGEEKTVKRSSLMQPLPAISGGKGLDQV